MNTIRIFIPLIFYLFTFWPGYRGGAPVRGNFFLLEAVSPRAGGRVAIKKLPQIRIHRSYIIVVQAELGTGARVFF